MFRRTMAMLTDQFPGSEIAWASSSSTSPPERGQPLDTGLRQRRQFLGRASGVRDRRRPVPATRGPLPTHKTGEPIGYGPGAERMAHTFNDIQHTAQARGGDATVERALLRKARISIRFGILNHCVMDENNPVGAVCLENAVVPEGHKGPLHDRCRPDRCANSVSALNTCRSGPPSGAPC